MALLNAVVLQSKEGKGGRNKVRISVAHNGETRYIVTDIVLSSTKEFKNGAVVKRPDATMLNVKIRGLLQRYQSALDELDYIEGLSCPELVFQLKNAGNYKHRTLKSIHEEYIERAHIKPSTARVYNNTWKIISEHLNDKLMIEHVNQATIYGLDNYLRKRGLGPTTIRNYISYLRVLLCYAKKCGYVQYRIDPFVNYKTPQLEVRQSWISVDDVRTIRDLKSTKSNIQKCRDLFMLSYYLGGINITDLLDINFNEQNDVLRYVRKKTKNRHKLNKFVEFKIPDEAKPIIERRKSPDGFLKISKFQYKDKLSHFFLRSMSNLAEATGIKNLIYYSARKSFSQHAFDLGISTSVIDYILGHRVDKGGTSLYNYISVTPKMASEAIRKVLDNLK